MVVGLLLALVGRVGWALEADATLAQFHHTVYDAERGAPGDVWAIAQTVDGWMWFGGSKGLYRFDGLRFERVDTGPNSPPSRTISTMFSLDSGELWIGYQSGAVSVLKNGQFTHFPNLGGIRSGPVWCFARDADGRVWAATSGGLMRFNGTGWAPVGSESGFPEGSPTSVFSDQKGTLWVASSGELFSLGQGTGHFNRTGLLTGRQVDFIQSTDGRTWYVDEFGVHPLPNQDGTSARAPSINSRTSYTAMFDSHGQLWTMWPDAERLVYPPTATQLVHFDPSKSDPSSPGSQVYREGPKTVFEDREGNVWITTVLAVHRFRRTNIKRLSSSNDVLGAAFAPSSSGTMWMAIDTSLYARFGRDGVWKFDDHFEHVQQEEIKSASAICRGLDGSIWIGGTQGLWMFDGARYVKKLDLPTVANRSRLQAIAVDGEGSVWGSFRGAGLFRSKSGVWERNGGLKQLPSDAPRFQTVDQAARLWLGYQGGFVIAVENGQATTFSVGAGAGIGPVTAIHSGHFNLAGGETGLALIRDQRLVPLRATDPAALEAISGIVETAVGDVWINGALGLGRISMQAMTEALEHPDRTIAVEVFGSSDGYPGSGNVLPAAMPLPRLSNGKDQKIWLSGPDGIAWIDPGKIDRNTVAPTAVVGSVLSEGRIYPSNAAIRLPEGTRRLQVDYTALSYSQPERVKFRYRLVGVDDQWVDAGTRRQAFYTNLGPGRYEFMVTAMNESGLSAESPATVAIELSPTVFQTPAFRVVMVVTALALLLLAFRIGIRLVKARERNRLEGGILERERIARDLHDTLLQSTQGLIWQVQATAQQLAKEDPARASLENVLDDADAVMGEARRRIQGLRTNPSNPNDLSGLLANVPKDAWQGSEVDCKFLIEGTPRPLAAGVHEDTYRIGREAMLNAYRHARASSIEVQIIYGSDTFRLRVRDNGVGIPDSVLKSPPAGHWGLRGLNERALKIGARLEIWSGQNAGTEIELSMPARLAYESRARVFVQPLLRLVQWSR